MSEDKTLELKGKVFDIIEQQSKHQESIKALEVEKRGYLEEIEKLRAN